LRQTRNSEDRETLAKVANLYEEMARAVAALGEAQPDAAELTPRLAAD
jgi:hypothetical protein